MYHPGRTESALRGALCLPSARPAEIHAALHAIEINSPITERRIMRALGKLGDEAYELNKPDLAEQIMDVIGGLDLSDRGGVLPDDEEAKTAQVQMRIGPARKNAYVRAAQREGLTLAEWISKYSDKAERNRKARETYMELDLKSRSDSSDKLFFICWHDLIDAVDTFDAAYVNGVVHNVKLYLDQEHQVVVRLSSSNDRVIGVIIDNEDFNVFKSTVKAAIEEAVEFFKARTNL